MSTLLMVFIFGMAFGVIVFGVALMAYEEYRRSRTPEEHKDL